MSDERDVDDDGFPIFRPDPELVAKVRAQMATLVDCKALAAKMIAERTMPDRAALDALARDHGIDGSKTVTEVEGEDLGDVHDVADEAEVHALRYVPVAQWTPSDVYIMLAYGHGVPIAFALAEQRLTDDPLIEARHYDGDLLEEFARRAHEFDRGPMVKILIDRAETETWDLFQQIADNLELSDEEQERQRRRLTEGHRAAPGRDHFMEVNWGLERLANVTDRIDPPEFIAVAEGKQRFARYRPRKSVELVPLPDLEVEEYRQTLDNEDTFQFRRDTTFQIVKDRSGNGVRLRIFAVSAVEHSQGIWYPGVSEAKDAALRDYGISADAWQPAPPP